MSKSGTEETQERAAPAHVTVLVRMLGCVFALTRRGGELRVRVLRRLVG